jgi:hypothetical protein
MSQQFHQCRETNAQADHFCGIGVPEAVWGSAIGAARSFCRLM